MVRPVSTEKMDSLKSTTSSDTQFYKFSHGYDFKHTSTSPYCPQANGESESGVSIAKKILKQRDPFWNFLLMELHPTHPQVIAS